MLLHSCADRKERGKQKEIEIKENMEKVPQVIAVGFPSGNIKQGKAV